MTISSRTPEGTPSHCAVCGASTPIEFSLDTGDAPCPVCGCLLWKSAAAFDALTQWMKDHSEVKTDAVTAETHLRELDVDSLALVELIMEFEESYDVSIPPEQAEDLRTAGELIRYLLQHRPQE